MSTDSAANEQGSVIDTEGIRNWLERNLGAVERIELLPRWRPMWYADVRRGDELLELCIRGDRIDTMLTFPLHHEMLAQKLMHDHGVRVPKVHGWMDGLDAYVMDRLPGVHAVTGLADAERDGVMRECMRELAKIHRIPIGAAEKLGIQGGRSPREASRFVIDRFVDNFRKLRVRPDPFVEFILGYLDRHLVPAADRRTLIVWDSGQFLQEGGRFTTLIDFEVAHIGDPMSDLGMLVSRDPTIGFGSIEKLFGWYEEFSGTKVDRQAIAMHHLFGLLSCALSFHGALAAPTVDSHYPNNLKWVHVNNCSTVDVLARTMGVTLPEVALPAPANSLWAAPHTHMTHVLKAIKADEQYLRYQLDQLIALSEHLEQVDGLGEAVIQANLDDIEALLGVRPASWLDGDEALERFVLEDKGAHDRELLLLFNKRNNRLRLLNGPADRPNTERRKYQPVV